MSNDGVCSEPHTSWTQETCHSKRSSPCLATHLRRHSARHSTSGMACCPVSIKKAYSDQEKRRRKRKRQASKERAEALLKSEPYTSIATFRFHPCHASELLSQA